VRRHAGRMCVAAQTACDVVDKPGRKALS